jgi:hypothetical protein
MKISSQESPLTDFTECSHVSSIAETIRAIVVKEESNSDSFGFGFLRILKRD